MQRQEAQQRREPQQRQEPQSQAPKTQRYKKPESPISLYFWRWKTWISTTFALSMLESWEAFLVGTSVFVISYPHTPVPFLHVEWQGSHVLLILVDPQEGDC